MSGAPHAPVDWDRLRRAAAAAVPGQDDPALRRQVLQARAAALALPPAQAEEAGDMLDVLAFEVGGECYALETSWVAQACAMLPLTALPGVPNHVAGIVPWRGQVLAAVDLRSLLALPLARLADPAALLVLQGEGMELALLADAIGGVRRYPRASLQRDLPGLEHLAPGYLFGVAPDRTAILDAAVLLADPRLVVQCGQ